MLSVVIFDCDGVLFDSWRANVAFYNAVLAQMGLPRMSAEWEERAHVMASGQLYDAMFGTESARASAARHISHELDYGPFYRFMEPAAGLGAVLTALQRSYRLAMATNRGRTVSGVVRRFGLDRFFELAVGILDVARPKPCPDLLDKCLAHFQVAPTAAVYVGDAETDRQAALAAGVHFVGVGEHCNATDRITDLRELPEILSAFQPTR